MLSSSSLLLFGSCRLAAEHRPVCREATHRSASARWFRSPVCLSPCSQAEPTLSTFSGWFGPVQGDGGVSARLWNQAGSSLSNRLTWNHTETKKGLKAAAETSWTGRKTQSPRESCVFFMKPNCFSWNSACRDLKIVPHSVCVSVRDAAPSCASKN